MKTLFIECNMGAAGDMLMASLFELLPIEKQNAFLYKMNTLGIPGLHIEPMVSTKCGIQGVHMSIHIHDHEEESLDVSHGHGAHTHEDHTHTHHHEENSHKHHEHMHQHHSHNTFFDISHIINSLRLSDKVKLSAIAVYELIAMAESKAHGKPVAEVHFHEVGALDAVADIVGCCLLIELLHVEKIVASPIHVGSGQVKCAHGILPVPAPATVDILRGVPIYSGTIQGELCTPTGAALLKHFVQQFTPMPTMSIESIGYGMGKKDFEVANCVRTFLGETDHTVNEIIEIACNLDDMTGEAIAYAFEKLLQAGALDVFTSSIMMKKNRLATMLTVLCDPKDEEILTEIMLLHTTTLGVRKTICQRRILDRKLESIDSKFGKITIKSARIGATNKYKPEFEEIIKLAEQYGVPIAEIMAAIPNLYK